MILLDEKDRQLVADALEAYIAYCEHTASGTGDLSDVALSELRPIRAWWGRVMAGTANVGAADNALSQALREWVNRHAVNYQVRAWIKTALEFYIRFCEGEKEIGGRRDEQTAAALRVIGDSWRAQFFG
jgi:hypothetical protein